MYKVLALGRYAPSSLCFIPSRYCIYMSVYTYGTLLLCSPHLFNSLYIQQLLRYIHVQIILQEWMCPRKPSITKRQVEIKILFLLCCYCIIWSDVIAVNVATLIESNDYRNAIIEHFTCEAAGVGGCPQDTFERFDIVSKTIAYALIGIYPAIFLVYFAKKRLHTCSCLRTATMTSTGSSASAPSRNV